jgi:NADH-quinone oxidoreductase subunit H
LAISSLNVYGIISGGWASNSKYASLGSLRSAAQMISYEVSIGLVILPVVILTNSFNLTDIIIMQEKTVFFFFPLFPCFIIFFISMLAETNRAPFDLPEAEAELVAGYNVEYGSMAFALFFLGEYSNMLLMSTLITILFCGG